MIMYGHPTTMHRLLPDVKGGKLPPNFALLIALIIVLLGILAYAPH